MGGGEFAGLRVIDASEGDLAVDDGIEEEFRGDAAGGAAEAEPSGEFFEGVAVALPELRGPEDAGILGGDDERLGDEGRSDGHGIRWGALMGGG